MTNSIRWAVAGAMLLAGVALETGPVQAMPTASLSVIQSGTASIDQVRYGWRRGWRRGGARHIGHRGPRIGSYAR